VRGRRGLILAAAVLLTGSGGARPALPAGEVVAYASGMVFERLGPAEPDDDAPVVVLVHGCCGDRRDLGGLARALARRGALVLNTDVHALGDGGGWPATYTDTVCAVAAGHAQARALGGDHPVVLVGWSEGAFVGAAVTMGWSTIRGVESDCAAPLGGGPPDLFVGVSGHYGWTGDVPAAAVTARTEAWFGGSPTARPEAWRQGVPGWWADQVRPAATPPLALIATDDDDARAFWQALVERGFEAQLFVIAGGTHGGLINPRGADGSAALALISGLIGVTG
jgi:dienelactone hydrolase